MTTHLSSADLFGHATARAPGKVNLALSVGPPRADGYHPVATLYLAVSMVEEVTATPRRDGHISVSLSDVSSAFADPETVPLDGTNLAAQAAALLRSHLQLDPEAHGVHLEITKQVPVAGGMGGGSADAAAALAACAGLWDAGLSRDELGRLGASLGADVPFAVTGGVAVGRGRGDELTPVLSRAPIHLVLVPASQGLSTPEVYRTLDQLRDDDVLEPSPHDPDVSSELIEAVANGHAESIALLMSNDLQVPATSLIPELSDMIDIGMEEGALAGQVSGSGPTVMFVSRSAEEAMQLAGRIQDRTGVAAVPVHGPYGGAKLI